MKTLTKKAIVLASAIAVAGTFAVLAADTSITVDPITADLTTKSVSVPYVLPTTMASTDQVTILAYQVTTANPTPVAENIVFIDQVEKSTTDGAIEFTLRDGFGEGNYKVLMGGTGLAQAGEGTFTLTAAATNGTVTGSVTSANDAVKPSITITGGAVNQTVVAGTDNTYSVDVPDGTYTVVLTQKGHIKRTFSNVVVTAGTPTALATTSLAPGDVNDDEFVEDTDFNLLNAAWYLDSSSANFEVNADLNGDEFIEDTDFNLLNANWYRGTEVYDN